METIRYKISVPYKSVMLSSNSEATTSCVVPNRLLY